jgi:hypothetical protein
MATLLMRSISNSSEWAVKARFSLEPVGRKVHRPDQLLMAGDRVPIGHSGDEVTDRPQLLRSIAATLPRLRQA